MRCMFCATEEGMYECISSRRAEQDLGSLFSVVRDRHAVFMGDQDRVARHGHVLASIQLPSNVNSLYKTPTGCYGYTCRHVTEQFQDSAALLAAHTIHLIY